MRAVPSKQQNCVSDASANQNLSIRERAKLALIKANASKNQKRSLSQTTAPQPGSENKAPRTHCCPSASQDKKSGPHSSKLPGHKPATSSEKEAAAQFKSKLKPKERKPLTDFEKAFGVAEEHTPAEDEADKKRLRAMAGSMEWSLFSSECKRLAEQERIEDRMANHMEMKVGAFHCKTCNVTSESKRPQCATHDVKRVQATKRWFRCGSCGNRTSSVARRFPAWRCDRCRMQDWQPCSMYVIAKDKVAEVQNEVYGYGDRELLKVSGPDFDTRL